MEQKKTVEIHITGNEEKLESRLEGDSIRILTCLMAVTAQVYMGTLKPGISQREARDGFVSAAGRAYDRVTRAMSDGTAWTEDMRGNEKKEDKR